MVAVLLPPDKDAGRATDASTSGAPKLVAAFEDRSVLTWKWSEIPDGRGLPFSTKLHTKARLQLARRAPPGRRAAATVAVFADRSVATVGYAAGRVRFHDAQGEVLSESFEESTWTAELRIPRSLLPTFTDWDGVVLD